MKLPHLINPNKTSFLEREEVEFLFYFIISPTWPISPNHLNLNLICIILLIVQLAVINSG
jgi:hypothetical protein